MPPPPPRSPLGRPIHNCSCAGKTYSPLQICVGKKLKLHRFPELKELDDIIKELTTKEQPNIVVFVTIQRDSHGLLKAKKRHPRGSKLSLVGSLAWSNRRDITDGVEDV